MMTDTLQSKVRSYLEPDWSPEQISGRLKQVDGISLHHETIYRYILSDKKDNDMLYKQLRHQGAIVTLDERISKLRMAYPVNSKQAGKVSQAIIRVLNPMSCGYILLLAIMARSLPHKLFNLI